VPKGEICALCRNPLGEAAPVAKIAGFRGERLVICPTCAELADGGPWGTVFLVNRAVAMRLFAGLRELFDEIGKLRDVVGKLKPWPRFRIRSYMIGVVVLAGLLAVPHRDMITMLFLAVPGLVTAGERWLWWHGYRRLGLCLEFRVPGTPYATPSSGDTIRNSGEFEFRGTPTSLCGLPLGPGFCRGFRVDGFPAKCCDGANQVREHVPTGP